MNSSIQSLDTPQGESHSSGYLPRMFQIRGRIGRVRFIAYSLIIIFLFFGSIGFYTEVVPLMDLGVSSYNALSFILIPVMIFLAVMRTVYEIRRLNDLNVTGWACLLSFVPMVNLLFYLALAFLPGSRGDNAYGQPPLRNGRSVYLVLILLILMGLLAFSLIGMYGSNA